MLVDCILLFVALLPFWAFEPFAPIEYAEAIELPARPARKRAA